MIATVDGSFQRQLLSLAKQYVKVRRKASINNYAELQYSGTATTYPAHIYSVTRANLTLDNQEYVVDYRAYIPSTDYVPSLDDEVQFPDGTIRKVVEADIRYDQYGQQGVILSLGKYNL
jgi:cell division protein FtsL